MMTPLIQVALGGAIGASLRFLTVTGATRLLGTGFPFGTMTVNLLGSFIMGLAAVFLLEHLPRYMPLVMTGVLGGFTTFSAFSLDAVTLYERGALGLAALYVTMSVFGAIVALFAGLLIARGFVS